jgi:hypothetical protein
VKPATKVWRIPAKSLYWESWRRGRRILGRLAGLFPFWLHEDGHAPTAHVRTQSRWRSAAAIDRLVHRSHRHRADILNKDIRIQMAAFINPGFQERQEAAARARNAALAKFLAKPPVDEAVIAERIARRQAREAAAAEKRAAEAEKRAAARRAREEAEEARREQERLAAAAAEAAIKAAAESAAQARADAAARKREERKNWTEEDRKAARDARYAARKARQGRR